MNISFAALAAARRQALWNATVAERAIGAEIGATHTTYLHPTKGYRRVSNKRLGLGPAIFR